jgi:hypothetical protein
MVHPCGVHSYAFRHVQLLSTCGVYVGLEVCDRRWLIGGLQGSIRSTWISVLVLLCVRGAVKSLRTVGVSSEIVEAHG